MSESAASSPTATQSLVERMAEAATAWLDSLSPDQRRKAQFGFPDNVERATWYYTPTERGGLPLSEMDSIQHRLAHRLIASGLSLGGYVTAATIMGLENVLDMKEGWRHTYSGRALPNRGRDPLLYFLAVFGDAGTGSWAWRVGGHHVAFSHTIVEGRLASPTPIFFGSNPAEAPQVGSAWLRPLASEEDVARDLLHSLDADQRAEAVLAPVAPWDIVQKNRPFVETGILPDRAGGYEVELRCESAPRGLAGARMGAAQRETMAALVRQYVDRLPEEIAGSYRERLLGANLDALHFAWAGASERRRPHYYRVQGPRLLIEYDNTQNDANHAHTVLRDPEGDFGADLLTKHHREAH